MSRKVILNLPPIIDPRVESSEFLAGDKEEGSSQALALPNLNKNFTLSALWAQYPIIDPRSAKVSPAASCNTTPTSSPESRGSKSENNSRRLIEAASPKYEKQSKEYSH